MKKYILSMLCALCGLSANAQWVVTAPTMELQTALNHVENMRQAVETYQTMSSIKQGINKGVETLEKVNSRLTTIREVQQIVTRSQMCIKRIEVIYKTIPKMELGVQATSELMGQCTQATRECVNLTAYGSKIFTSNFMKMSDKDRIDETRKVLEDIDKLLGRVNGINTQAKVIQFNNQMINAYIK